MTVLPNFDHNRYPIEWQSIEWPFAVTILSHSEDDDQRFEAATRVYVDLGINEVGFESEWNKTFQLYDWDGDETLEDAKRIFGSHQTEQ